MLNAYTLAMSFSSLEINVCSFEFKLILFIFL